MLVGTSADEASAEFRSSALSLTLAVPRAQAEVIVWSYNDLSRFGSHNLHKVKVEAVAFSPNDVFMASLGGQDDGNVIVYDMATKDPLCGTAWGGGAVRDWGFGSVQFSF